jgi:hypothetical protein
MSDEQERKHEAWESLRSGAVDVVRRYLGGKNGVFMAYKSPGMPGQVFYDLDPVAAVLKAKAASNQTVTEDVL